MENIDSKVVQGFGEEWSRYDQSELSPKEIEKLFNLYFHLFPFDQLPAKSQGFDLGCGTGRWAKLVASKVGILHCIDPAEKALKVAKRNLAEVSNVRFHLASVGDMPLAEGSMDFGYSLGVLHHVPDTLAGLKSCVSKLKPGAPFLIYLYYAFDNRPLWFRMLHTLSECFRKIICRLPYFLRAAICWVIASTLYLPLARLAQLAEKLRKNVDHFPLSFYRDKAFYVMKTDALDRFGTALEKRFTRDQISTMMKTAGLHDIRFSETAPYWCAVGVTSKVSDTDLPL